MKKILILLCMALILASCEEVVYPDPQPPRVKALKEIPDPLRGLYLDLNLDTLVVGQRSFIYLIEDPEDVQETFLSDSVVLKSYKGKYFLSLTISIGGNSYWLTYMLDQDVSTGTIDVYTMAADDVVKMAMLQEITSKVSDLESGSDEYYLFAPKKKHYKKIIRDTIFTKFNSFTRITP